MYKLKLAARKAKKAKLEAVKNQDYMYAAAFRDIQHLINNYLKAGNREKLNQTHHDSR